MKQDQLSSSKYPTQYYYLRTRALGVERIHLPRQIRYGSEVRIRIHGSDDFQI